MAFRFLFVHTLVVLFEVSFPFPPIRTVFAGKRRLFSALEASVGVQTLPVLVGPLALVALET